jgi:16S rRNA (cytosine967-C5)-methyltransferase
MRAEATIQASESGWGAAWQLLTAHLRDTDRLDHLLERLPPGYPKAERRRCQRLLFGAVRHLSLLNAALDSLMRRPPRPALRSLLLLGAYELLEGSGERAPIVHHAVEQAKRRLSSGEAAAANAVLRKLPDLIAERQAKPVESAEDLALIFSHPSWLVRRWVDRFGMDQARQLLEWNQRPAPLYARRAANTDPAGTENVERFRPTPWPGFLEISEGSWAEVERLLDAGKVYLQDPATRLSVEMLDPQPGERVLDLCSAPGGKSLQIAERLKGSEGMVVSVDLPGLRFERLQQNISRYGDLPIVSLAADVLELRSEDLAGGRLPESYDAVLLDAPCSNTGVLRHRVDAKWRLRQDQVRELADLQMKLLKRAAFFTRPGGRMVYSTCSLEPEENEQVVRRFLESGRGQWTLERELIALPWQAGHDGAGCFLLRRQEAQAQPPRPSENSARARRPDQRSERRPFRKPSGASRQER